MRSERGFTLIELMIVVVILGLITAMAIPRFQTSSYRAKEKEADSILKQIHTLQQTYFAQHGMYATTVVDLKSVGFEEPSRLAYYGWGGDANVPYGTCLATNPPFSEWGGRAISATGEITSC